MTAFGLVVIAALVLALAAGAYWSGHQSRIRERDEEMRKHVRDESLRSDLH